MTRALLAIAAALLASCNTRAFTYTGKFDASHFSERGIAPGNKIEGRALVLTTAEDDAFVFSGRPTTFTGSAMTLRLPLGMIAREAALRVFGDLFVGGADASNDRSTLEGYRAVISPRVVRFSHEYRMFGSPRFTLSVHVSLLDPRGGVEFENTYEAGPLEAHVPGKPPSEEIAWGAHVATQALMLRAAVDVKERLEKSKSLNVRAP